MKKYSKLLFLFLFVVIMIGVVIFYRRISFYSVVDNTINNKDKINYTTNIELISIYKGGSMKIQYELVKYADIKKVTINDYINNNLENSLLKYIKGNKTYVYDNESYEEKENAQDEFNVNYNYLKDKLINLKSKSGNKYIIKMNTYDAYNLIYDKEILSKKQTQGTTDVTIIVNENSNFIEEISYEIDDLNIYNNDNNLSKYKVKIKNIDINNVNEIKLPFKKS